MITRSRKQRLDESVMEVGDSKVSPSKVSSNHNGDLSLSDDDMEDHTSQHFMEMSLADKASVVLLTFLYILQGIPLGLAGSVPYILSSRNVSFTDQATFSFTFWPFSLKLLWAPFVDSVYWPRFGRRKSWLIPSQYCIGLFMILLSRYSTQLLGDAADPKSVAIIPLTAGFFALCFLAATQDIAVDGWALTMLSRRNVGWASSCNSLGQTAGYFIAYVLFLALESPTFCNTWLRNEPQKEGLVTLSSFLVFWGIVFMVTTTVVMILKTELDVVHERDPGIMETYGILMRIVRLRPIITYVSTLFMIKFAFGAADGITGLKLIAAGVPKEKLAFVGVLVLPFQLALPVIISKRIGNEPLSLFTKAILPRLFMGLVFALIVYVTPFFKDSKGDFSLYYFGMLIGFYVVHQIFVYSMFVSVMAFHAKISDPSIGGSYMTLLNTICNLAGNWPTTALLYIVESLTYKQCPPEGGECVTIVDGYYTESLVCFIVGIVVLYMRKSIFTRLQTLPLARWTVS